MTWLLRAPLLPAAALALAAALVAMASRPLASAMAACFAVAAIVLALASGTRALRVMWVAAAAASTVCAVRLALGPLDPLAGLDLTHAGPLDAVRDALERPIARLVPEPESGILLGVILGRRGAVDPDVSLAFARSGLAYLLAVSGFHLMFVTAFLALALRGRARPPAAAALTIAALAAYALVVGLRPNVVRAALMAFVGAFALAAGRRATSENALAGAVTLMLAFDPATLEDAGFLMSAGATAGLLVFRDPIAARLRRLPRAIGAGLATTIAASLPTLPVVVAVFGNVPLVSPVANLVAVPLVAPLMAAGALTSLVGVVSLDAARLPAVVAYAAALALRAIVSVAAAAPGADVVVPKGPLSGLVMGALLVAAIAFAPRITDRVAARLALRIPIHLAMPRALRSAPRAVPRIGRRAALAAALAAAALVAAVPLALLVISAPPEVRVRALDVGQGDAYLIESGGRYALVDGGPDPARLLAELGTVLPPWSRRIDLVALTHAHVDHGAGLIAVLERYEVGLALEPVGLNDVTLTQLWADRVAKAGVARRAVAAGARVRVGDLRITVLSPIDDPKVDVPSLALRVERGPFSMLFLGDATDQAQADLLLAPAVLPTRVYVPPHHGAATPYASALVAAVRPEMAVISVGAGNRYGHPTPETLDALRAVPVYRTDLDGTVEIDADGQRLLVRTRANDLPPPRGGPVPYAPAPRRAGRGAARGHGDDGG